MALITKPEYQIGQYITVCLRYSSNKHRIARINKFNPETANRYAHYLVTMENGDNETVVLEEIVKPVDITAEFSKNNKS